MAASVFGSTTRDRILKFIALSKSSYPRELSRALEITLSNVQSSVAALQESGLIATRLVGRTRVVELNPNWFAAVQLREFLERLNEADPSIRRAVATIRKRPRRPGKPI